MYQASTGTTIGHLMIQGGTSNSITINFSSPMLLSDTNVAIVPSTAVTAKISFDITGWYEDKV